MIEYYEEISLNSKLVVEHILDDKSHLALKQQVFWLMYLDKLNSDEIELLLNMYLNDNLEEQLNGLKDLIPGFFKNLLLMNY